jgi:hypothetical protein
MAFEKATYDDLPEDNLDRLNVFRYMDREELTKIVPVWISENSKEYSEGIDFDRYCIIDVNVKHLLKSVELIGLPTDEIFTDDINDLRYVTTLERWQNNKPVDPPTINISDTNKNKLTISDGRHRTVLTNCLKQKNIPILVNKNSKDSILKIIASNE